MASVWDLPGPSRFASEIAACVQQGASAVVHLPRGAPEGLARSIGAIVRRIGSLSWSEIEVSSTAGAEPAVAVAEALQIQAENSTEALASSGRLAGRAIWIDAIPAASASHWNDFLWRFAMTCRNYSAGDCGVLLVPFPAEVSPGNAGTDPGLRLVRWKGRVGRLDGLIWLAEHANADSGRSLEWDLRVAVALELAGTDLLFARELLECSRTHLFTPTPLLLAEARRRGWKGPLGSNAWSDGRIDERDGASIEHAASLAIRNAQSEINRRLWRAQLSVVFPALETRRLEIVETTRHLLRPATTPFGYIDRIEDLEIAHVLYQLRSKRRPELVNQLWHMNEMRKALAHLETIQEKNLVGAGLICSS